MPRPYWLRRHQFPRVAAGHDGIDMDLQLQGRQVVVTGGTRGIGLACAQAFLREGCELTVIGSRQASIDRALHTLDDAAHVRAVRADLASLGELARLEACFESADVLVNNAGAIPPAEIADLVVFLASERASYLSGMVVDADGGRRHG